MIWKTSVSKNYSPLSALFGSTYTKKKKIGTTQRRLAWPLRKDDTQIREAFHVKNSNCSPLKTSRKEITGMQTNSYF